MSKDKPQEMDTALREPWDNKLDQAWVLEKQNSLCSGGVPVSQQ